MTDDGLRKLAARAEQDEELAAALAGAATPEDFVRIAGEHGVTVRADEMVTEIALTDAELENASGGTNAAWYWATAPEFCGTQGRLCTIYAPYCTPA